MASDPSIAIITGASGGIGMALCAKLAERGLRVLAVGRDPQRLMHCCQAAPERIEAFHADISLEHERGRLISLAKSLSPLCYLVHAAAVIEPISRVQDLTLSEFRSAQAINVEAPLFLSIGLSQALRGGRILHLSSGAAHEPVAGCLSYCVTKAALHMQYRALNAELGQAGVIVGSASPGAADTPMQQKLRDADPEYLPSTGRFRDLSQHGLLQPTERSARFLTWLLLDASDHVFAERDWNIQDPALRPHWDPPRASSPQAL